jgi:hypothetical protein
MGNPSVPNLPSIFTFFALSGQYLNWFLQDSLTNLPINNSVITATLYKDRSLTNPTGQPGTPVTFFTGVSIAYVPNTNGQYRAVIPATFDPPLGTDYVLVVDAVTPGYADQHWETAAQVVSGAPTITVNPIITIAQFRSDYPEFADPGVYPDSAIRYWLAFAKLLLNPSRWCDMLGNATELYVAHNIQIEAQAQQTALKQGWPGMSKGAVTGETAGSVTVSYDAAVTLEEKAGHWNLTVYGTRFIRLAWMFGAGPIQIGPSFFGLAGSGSGIGFFAFPGAWVGPWPLPEGMSSFGQ